MEKGSLFFGLLFIFIQACAPKLPCPASTPGTVSTSEVKQRQTQEQFDPSATRIVSLVPSVTEIIVALGANATLVGVTHHDYLIPGIEQKAVVGGFLSPSLDIIESLRPSLVVVSGLHAELEAALKEKGIPIFKADVSSMEASFARTEALGAILGKQKEALDLNRQIMAQIEHIEKKIMSVESQKRKRVIRIMGRKTLMTPGPDSFQNRYIEKAGGIPLLLDKKGAVVPVTRQEWMDFNPEYIYYCGGDSVLVETVLQQPGWKDVDAVKNNRIVSFPCELTCRMSVHAGDFVSSLASSVYFEHFTDETKEIISDRVVTTKKVVLPLDYVSQAQVVDSYLFDFVNKTLLVDFVEPMAVLSTLHGYQPGIETVGNHSTPAPVWGALHKYQSDYFTKRLSKSLGRPEKTMSLLFTGANMNHLVVETQSFKSLKVYALVTAGVRSNAMRAGADIGFHYEHGTINIVLMANRKLSPKVMARSIIAATEGKTAAIQDLDIRSSYNPEYQATGTGTDNITVVSGLGAPINSAGGHTKLGELVSKAVYAGVIQAISKQNGLVAARSIFGRLAERGLSPARLAEQYLGEYVENPYSVSREMEKLLINARYNSFLEMALAISDGFQRGIVKDLNLFQTLCDQIASEISDKSNPVPYAAVKDEGVPKVSAMALNALITGLLNRDDFKAQLRVIP